MFGYSGSLLKIEYCVYIFITYAWRCMLGNSHFCFKEFIFMVKELASSMFLVLLYSEMFVEFLSQFELLI